MGVQKGTKPHTHDLKREPEANWAVDQINELYFSSIFRKIIKNTEAYLQRIYKYSRNPL